MILSYVMCLIACEEALENFAVKASVFGSLTDEQHGYILDRLTAIDAEYARIQTEAYG